MYIIFETVDKTRRKIRLTEKQWKHIKQDYPEIENEEIIKETLEKPTKITQPYTGMKHYCYKYFKHRQPPDKYLMVVVNYLSSFCTFGDKFFTENSKYRDSL